MTLDARDFLTHLYEEAVKAAHPRHCFNGYWPEIPGDGQLIILTAGKAGAAMARAAEDHYGPTRGFEDGRIVGIAVTRHGYLTPLDHFELIEAGHPTPDEGSVRGSDALLGAAERATSKDTVLFLLSGGASALLAAPVTGLTLADKQSITKSLLRSGAPISEINTVRRHLSRIKGGRLAAAAAPARLITLAISDVPGDEPAAIASGPTVADETTLADARRILKVTGDVMPDALLSALQDPANESIKPGDPRLKTTYFELVATPSKSLSTVEVLCAKAGYRVINLGDELEGEARDVAEIHAAKALELECEGVPIALISGGELSVTIKGDGDGGPNQEYALALALALRGKETIFAFAADTDGADGGRGRPDDPAGAFVFPGGLNRTSALGLDAHALLENNASLTYFQAAGGVFRPGPTQTNVNDLRVILINGPHQY